MDIIPFLFSHSIRLYRNRFRQAQLLDQHPLSFKKQNANLLNGNKKPSTFQEYSHTFLFRQTIITSLFRIDIAQRKQFTTIPVFSKKALFIGR